MTPKVPFQPLLFCNFVIYIQFYWLHGDISDGRVTGRVSGVPILWLLPWVLFCNHGLHIYIIHRLFQCICRENSCFTGTAYWPVYIYEHRVSWSALMQFFLWRKIPKWFLPVIYLLLSLELIQLIWSFAVPFLVCSCYLCWLFTSLSASLKLPPLPNWILSILFF